LLLGGLQTCGDGPRRVHRDPWKRLLSEGQVTPHRQQRRGHAAAPGESFGAPVRAAVRAECIAKAELPHPVLVPGHLLVVLVVAQGFESEGLEVAAHDKSVQRGDGDARASRRRDVHETLHREVPGVCAREQVSLRLGPGTDDRAGGLEALKRTCAHDREKVAECGLAANKRKGLCA